MKQTSDKPLPILKLVVDALGTEVKVRTFDLSVSAYLGGVYLQNMQFKGGHHMFGLLVCFACVVC
jgi:hypothetical protein